MICLVRISILWTNILAPVLRYRHSKTLIMPVLNNIWIYLIQCIFVVCLTNMSPFLVAVFLPIGIKCYTIHTLCAYPKNHIANLSTNSVRSMNIFLDGRPSNTMLAIINVSFIGLRLQIRAALFLTMSSPNLGSPLPILRSNFRCLVILTTLPYTSVF